MTSRGCLDGYRTGLHQPWLQVSDDGLRLGALRRMQAHARAVHAVHDEIEAQTPVRLGQLELLRVGFGTINEAALKARDAIAHKGPSMR